MIQKILILDFGSQTTQLIARRVREAGVYSEVHRYTVDFNFIKAFNPAGIILSGSPETVLLEDTPRVPEGVFTLGVPVLGICYGMQVMAQQLGGIVQPAVKREFGYAKIHENGSCMSAANTFPTFVKGDAAQRQGDLDLNVWMSHGDHVVGLPPGFVIAAYSENAPIAAMRDENRRFYGLQFHPEVTHTENGQQMITQFVRDICGCENHWTADNIIDDTIVRIKEQVGEDYVLLGLSGGVDSSVVAALLHKAIGEKLICVFVDHGLLRLNEAQQVMKIFSEQMGVKVILVNAQDLFLNNLKNVSCPEQKRKIIGKLFIDVFESEANKLAYKTDIKWLAQGTIYPDVIESVGIKSHHNVGGLPNNMNFKLVEPLRALFKDEVKKVGLALGLSEQLIHRHPFPGPGLGVRVLGEVKPEYTHILRQADAIFLEVLHEFDYYHQVSQAFAVFLPVKAVGVMGDAREYEYVIALRAVQTIDFMTARWAHLPYELLEKASNRIINEVKGITRVTYDISGKPPATIEWE